MPDPILVGRNAAKVAALAQAHGVERWTTDLDAALANKDDAIYFDSASTGLRPELIRKAIAAGKHIYTEKPVAPTRRRRARPLPARRGRGREARRRAGQALAARAAQAQDADRLGLLRTHPLGARRVRLLGVRGRLAARAAAVVELPQGGRRRHHRRHAVPLALRARQPVRRSEERDVPRRDAHSASAGTRTASRTPRPPTTPRTRRSSSRTASSRRSTARGARACAATISSRSMSTARSARPWPGSPIAASSRARRRPSRSGIPTCRRRSTSTTRGSSSRRTARTTTRSRSSGSSSCGTSSTAARSSWNLLEGAKGVQLAELGLQSWRERRFVDVPALAV